MTSRLSRLRHYITCVALERGEGDMTASGAYYQDLQLWMTKLGEIPQQPKNGWQDGL